MAAAQDAAPSLPRQKTFIVENGELLDNQIRRAILRLVVMEVGRQVVMENEKTGMLSVDLDRVAEHEGGREVVRHIYNMVLNRRAALDRPAPG